MQFQYRMFFYSKRFFFLSDKHSMKRFSIFFILLFLTTNIFSQKALPTGYKNIFLGMSLQQTKDELIKNHDFGYKGDRDVSLIPGTNQKLIETDTLKHRTSPFLKRRWFQFSDDKLFTIIINLNSEKIDYYSILMKLKEKYGEPKDVTPQRILWKDENTTLSLEKPLSLKYMDNKTYDELQKSSDIQLSAKETTQKMFLEEL